VQNAPVRARPRIVASLVLVLATSATARGARAAEPAVRLRYAAPSGCPNASWFWRQVRLRTARVHVVADVTLAPVLDVAIEAPSGTKGRLSLRALDGTVTEREIEGEGCTEVASALALIAALALDPEARTSPDVTRGERPLDRSASDLLDVAPPVLPVPTRFGTTLGTRASVATGLSPSPLVGGVFDLELAWEHGAFLTALRLGVDRAISGRFALRAVGAAATANVSRTVALVELRPWRWIGGLLTLAPVATLEVGALHVDGAGIVPALRPTRPCAGLELGGGASVALYGPLRLDLGAAFTVPFVRDAFFVASAPSVTVLQAAPAGFRGSLGLGGRFP
jgi:hypothetical protein